MRPVLLFGWRIAVTNTLQVKRLVDVFEEGEAHDAVVRALVFEKRGCAKLGGARVCAVCSRGVEDFVDTTTLARNWDGVDLRLTMVSRHLAVRLLP